MGSPMDTLKCELCGLEHMPGATRCDGCDQVLGQPLDIPGMREELRQMRLRVLLSVAALLLMILGSFVLFEGAGVIYLTAPIAIGFHSAWRWRALSRHLRTLATRRT